MRIGLHDADPKGRRKVSYPNLALMKLARHHIERGDDVYKFNPQLEYDKVYSSKVFTFKKALIEAPPGAEKSGTGYMIYNELPDEIEHACPRYDLYGIDYSMGYTTRGCPNKCSWCVVPEKEGDIKAHADVEEFLMHDKLVLMDNNPLACDHGIDQIGKLACLGVKVDYNQGLDARRIDPQIAKRLASLKWLSPLRLACDSQGQKKSIAKAVDLLRKAGCTPKKYFVYVLVKDVDEALDRIEFLRSLNLDPFAQPYRDPKDWSQEPTREQRRLARYVNLKKAFKSMTWQEYQDWRGERI